MSQIKGNNWQPETTRRTQSLKWTQPTWVPGHQCARQQTLAQQALRPVGVRHHQFCQTRPLLYPGLDLRPIGCRDDERKQIERPGPGGSAQIIVVGEGDVIIPKGSGQPLRMGIQCIRTEFAQRRKEVGPMAANAV